MIRRTLFFSPYTKVVCHRFGAERIIGAPKTAEIFAKSDLLNGAMPVFSAFS
jgi:hypothetical protein